MQCLQFVVFKARKFNIFGYWHKNNTATCKQALSSSVKGKLHDKKIIAISYNQADGYSFAGIWWKAIQEQAVHPFFRAFIKQFVRWDGAGAESQTGPFWISNCKSQME